MKSADSNDLHARVAEITAAARLAETAEKEGAMYGARLLEHQPGDWRRLMRSKPGYRSYGTLKFLLERARERWESEPTFAHQITSVVVDFVDRADAPSAVHRLGLRGLAYKEHANACEKRGELIAALSAARRAVAIYGESSVLLFDQTRAKLVVCKVLRELGTIDEAMQLAQECATTFSEFGSLPFTNMARMFVAGVLFTAKRFSEALEIVTDVMAKAEIDGDRLTVARCLQVSAQCARELGDLESARNLYPRALAHFEELNVPADANRARWGLAVTLAASGKVPYAVSELFKVRAVFLSLGMNTSAACTALDIVRIKFDHDEDVRDLCTEVVPLLTEAGLTQNAVEALAYLREQAKSGRLTAQQITRVRTFFEELTTKPTLLFARPRTIEQEEG